MKNRKLTIILIIALSMGIVSLLLAVFIHTPEMKDFFKNLAWLSLGFAVFDGAILLIDIQTQRGEDDRNKRIEDTHANALALRFSRNDEGLKMWAYNQGTHKIQNIWITGGFPPGEDWEDDIHKKFPDLWPSEVSSVNVTFPILGGWFLAQVEALEPDRGFMIFEALLKENDLTRIGFDVSWIDHSGKKRKSYGIVDAGREEGIKLIPRPERPL